MKTKRTIGLALVLAFAVSLGYRLGCQLDSTAGRLRITALGSLKHVDLSFHSGRNEIERFSATVPTPETQIQSR